ncbi:MAG: hypothetical protein M3151_04915 [Actinomycetota bacterium]|nr:hypothetical protein [Actinomycetota bacterium]
MRSDEELVQADSSSGFGALARMRRSQAATMVLASGSPTGQPDNLPPEVTGDRT